MSDLSRYCCQPVSDSALSSEQSEVLAAVFAALADPVRLRIYSMIASQGEVCSCALEEPTQRSQPTISHHTSKLAAAGLIEGERRGRWMWWRSVPLQRDEIVRLLVGGDRGDAPLASTHVARPRRTRV